MDKYNPSKIEAKWQKYWAKNLDLFEAQEESKKEKRFILDMFPYPSGTGLHVGHVESYTATDIYSRYLRMRGYNVLHPQGFDAFGLPAENYAVKTGVHPKITTEKAVEVFKKQMDVMGFSYDWSREVNSSLPEYYKWTQWLFLLLYKNGLAYKKKAKVNWCPKCQTVLANEQAENGKCERCESEVTQKDLEQWFFKITDFIEDRKMGIKVGTSGLLSGLEKIDWPESTKKLQENWVGRSEGAIIKFKIKSELSSDSELNSDFMEVFTTRVDTIFGCTYCVVAPEHEILRFAQNDIENYAEVEKYIEESKKKTDLDRMEAKEKTGVELKGIKAVNPFNGEAVPIWVADYVLAQYGTGAVMAVPAHDERDFEFAKKYNLPIRVSIFRRDMESRSFVMGVDENKLKEISVNILEKTEEGFLKIKIPYKQIEKYKIIVKEQMKPGFWNEFSTERGFCFIFKHKDGHVEELELNEKTNDIIDSYGASFNNEDAPEIKQRVYSWESWIDKDAFYRDLLIHTGDGILVDSEKYSGLNSEEAREKMTAWLEKNKLGEKKVNYRIRDWLVSRQRYWGAPIPIIYCEKCGEMPVPEKDLPVELPDDVNFLPTGESPLKYSKKFQNIVCPKCGAKAKRESDTMDTFVCSSWYYLRYSDPQNEKKFASKERLKKWLPVDLYVGGAEHSVLHLLYARFFTKVLHSLGYLEFDEPFTKLRHQGTILAEDGAKMSKSKGNVVNPDDVVSRFGADSLRCFEMFMGPLEDMKPWQTNGIIGVYRFLERVYKLNSKSNDQKTEDKKIKSLIHKTIKKVSEDIEGMKFNTAISQLMILANAFEKEAEINSEDYNLFLILLAPFAPHIAEELWEKLGYTESIFKESWPEYDPALICDEEIELVMQVNGKVRDKIRVSADISEEEAKKLALESEKIKGFIESKKIKKIIFVKGKLVNIVV